MVSLGPKPNAWVTSGDIVTADDKISLYFLVPYVSLASETFLL